MRPTKGSTPPEAVANDAALANAMAGGFRLTISSPEYCFRGHRERPDQVWLRPNARERGHRGVRPRALSPGRKGSFPNPWKPLSPRFLQKMPHDIITGAPLKYRRTPDGQFILYSVGWNEKDDGGQVVHDRSRADRSSDLTRGRLGLAVSRPSCSSCSESRRAITSFTHILINTYARKPSGPAFASDGWLQQGGGVGAVWGPPSAARWKSVCASPWPVISGPVTGVNRGSSWWGICCPDSGCERC